MKIIDTYFCELPNGAKAWLGVGKQAEGTVLEIRPMIFPDEGMALKHKETGDLSFGHWLKMPDSQDNWEEVEAPKEEN